MKSLNGVLKRRLNQHLLFRGSRDFSSVSENEHWVQGVMEEANGLRRKKVAEDLNAMKALDIKRLPEYGEEKVYVTSGSTINVKKNTYSGPSRLVGEKVKVRIFDDRIDAMIIDDIGYI